MTELLLKSFLSLIFISLCLYMVLLILQKYTKFGGGNFTAKNKKYAITINSVAYVDSSSKIVNFRCKNKDYLILIGKNNNLLLDAHEHNDI